MGGDILRKPGYTRSVVDALIMNPRDHVATALRPIAADEDIEIRRGRDTQKLRVRETIPCGHKIALTDMGEGQLVRKYGEVIGRLIAAVGAGDHVHVQNLVTCRSGAHSRHHEECGHDV